MAEPLPHPGDSVLIHMVLLLTRTAYQFFYELGSSGYVIQKGLTNSNPTPSYTLPWVHGMCRHQSTTPDISVFDGALEVLVFASPVTNPRRLLYSRYFYHQGAHPFAVCSELRYKSSTMSTCPIALKSYAV